MIRPWAALLALLAGCTPAQQARRPPPLSPWLVVLVAGDGSIPVFDNATRQMAALMQAAGIPAASVHRFSAAPATLAQPGVSLASKANVLNAIAQLRPQPGQACLVFMTSHGAHGPGLYLAPYTEFLSPADLDAALDSGCAGAPTVAVVSACYTGDFARPPMAQPNRIVLTAAARDRPSFGCGAGTDYAFYDDCLLRTLHSLPQDWRGVAATTGRCVAQLEARDHEPASMPQTAIGAEVEKLPVPG